MEITVLSRAVSRSFHTETSYDAAMHAFLDAKKRRDRVFTLHAIKRLFPHCQIYICVVKLETCPMQAITVAMDLARVVTRQCDSIIKIYSVLIFPLVALLHRSLARSLCERTLKTQSYRFIASRKACIATSSLALYVKKKNLQMKRVKGILPAVLTDPFWMRTRTFKQTSQYYTSKLD